MGKNWGEQFRTLASICAVLMFVGGILGAAFNLLPFAFAADVAKLSGRVSEVELMLKGIRLDQKETLELSLMQQIDIITVKLEAMAQTGIYTDLRLQRIGLNQRLDLVRVELVGLRAAR